MSRFGTVSKEAYSQAIPVLVWVWPFVVELFAVGVLVRSPKWHTPVQHIAVLAAPHASRVEGTRQGKSTDRVTAGSKSNCAWPHPHGRDYRILCVTRFVGSGLVIRPGMSASPVFENCEKIDFEQME